MGVLADCYVALKTRSKKQGLAFLDHFLPDREAESTVYELPQYGGATQKEFQNAGEVMAFMEQDPKAAYALYWRGTDAAQLNKQAMLFYTPDGAMIFGLSRETGSPPDTSAEDACLDKMLSWLQSKWGYIAYEQPPAETFEAFVALVEGMALRKEG